MRLLRCDLGRALPALLPLQSTALFAPLSPRTPCFRLDCRCRSQFHLHRNHQLPGFVPWVGYDPQTEGVCRPGCEGCCDCWYFHFAAILIIHFPGSADIWHSGVSFHFIFCFQGSLFTPHPPPTDWMAMRSIAIDYAGAGRSISLRRRRLICERLVYPITFLCDAILFFPRSDLVYALTFFSVYLPGPEPGIYTVCYK